jgi:hypothetical protein
MWPFSVEKGEPGPVEGRDCQFKLATNNSISHHEHVLYRLKLGYEPINRALDFGQNGARITATKHPNFVLMWCEKAYSLGQDAYTFPLQMAVNNTL